MLHTLYWTTIRSCNCRRGAGKLASGNLYPRNFLVMDRMAQSGCWSSLGRIDLQVTSHPFASHCEDGTHSDRIYHSALLRHRSHPPLLRIYIDPSGIPVTSCHHSYNRAVCIYEPIWLLCLIHLSSNRLGVCGHRSSHVLQLARTATVLGESWSGSRTTDWSAHKYKEERPRGYTH